MLVDPCTVVSPVTVNPPVVKVVVKAKDPVVGIELRAPATSKEFPSVYARSAVSFGRKVRFPYPGVESAVTVVAALER